MMKHNRSMPVSTYSSSSTRRRHRDSNTLTVSDVNTLFQGLADDDDDDDDDDNSNMCTTSVSCPRLSFLDPTVDEVNPFNDVFFDMEFSKPKQGTLPTKKKGLQPPVVSAPLSAKDFRSHSLHNLFTTVDEEDEVTGGTTVNGMFTGIATSPKKYIDSVTTSLPSSPQAKNHRSPTGFRSIGSKLQDLKNKASMRTMISKNKNRYQAGSFDLDLTYITDEVVAMSFPASGLETSYRNSLKDVAALLEENHGLDKCMVYNVSERSYDISKLKHQVLDFGWPDHHAPPLILLLTAVKSMWSWLQSQGGVGVAAVHCKGGKGRTGCLIAAYLVYSQICDSANSALTLYSERRFTTTKNAGVTQPSQQRYVHYVSDIVSGRFPNFSVRRLWLHKVVCHCVPNLASKGGCRPVLFIYVNQKLVFSSRTPGEKITCDTAASTRITRYTPTTLTRKYTREDLVMSFLVNVVVAGDITIRCVHVGTTGSKNDSIFRFQFHTTCGVKSGSSLRLKKHELDDACRMPDSKFNANGEVEVIFDPSSKICNSTRTSMEESDALCAVVDGLIAARETQTPSKLFNDASLDLERKDILLTDVETS